MHFEGSWGTICDDDWDEKSGNVVCRMLGYPGVHKAYINSVYGDGTGQIVLDAVICNGGESHIALCKHAGYEEHNCGQHEASGVVCSGEGKQLVELKIIIELITLKLNRKIFQSSFLGGASFSLIIQQ